MSTAFCPRRIDYLIAERLKSFCAKQDQKRTEKKSKRTLWQRGKK